MSSPTAALFVDSYSGRPPWDTGAPQPDLVEAFDALHHLPSALDLGCGTGENVLELARRGTDAWGLDSTPRAIELAREKALSRGLGATFVLGDALNLASLHRRFSAVVDCGLFHVLQDEERVRYVAELRHVLDPGGIHIMMGFQTNHSGRGPRGYSEAELRVYFAGWEEVRLRPGSFSVTEILGSMPTWVSVFVAPFVGR